jgi:hypothetical protein
MAWLAERKRAADIEGRQQPKILVSFRPGDPLHVYDLKNGVRLFRVTVTNAGQVPCEVRAVIEAASGAIKLHTEEGLRVKGSYPHTDRASAFPADVATVYVDVLQQIWSDSATAVGTPSESLILVAPDGRRIVSRVAIPYAWGEHPVAAGDRFELVVRVDRGPEAARLRLRDGKRSVGV